MQMALVMPKKAFSTLLHVPMVQVAFFICHFAACIFYFIARQYGFSDTTWIGANAAEVLDGKSTFLRCECPTHLVTGLLSPLLRAATSRFGMRYLLLESVLGSQGADNRNVQQEDALHHSWCHLLPCGADSAVPNSQQTRLPPTTTDLQLSSTMFCLTRACVAKGAAGSLQVLSPMPTIFSSACCTSHVQTLHLWLPTCVLLEGLGLSPTDLLGQHAVGPFTVCWLWPSSFACLACRHLTPTCAFISGFAAC